MKREICKMCLLEKDLVQSHLLPAALYDYLYEGDIRPLRVGDGVVMPSDRQTKDHLLCQHCEEILNKGGETWMNPKLCRMERTFPLYDLVTSGPLEGELDGNAIYFTGKNPLINIDMLSHFALGIFWKASVHSWRGNILEPMIDLGPHSNSIRKWLRGESEFPASVALHVTICRPARAQISINPPGFSHRTTCRTFWMHTLGVMFMMDVGATIPTDQKDICFHENSNHPIVVSDEILAKFERLLVKNFAGMRKTAAYLRQKK